MNLLEANALLRPHLMPGERILWAGRPRRGIYPAPWDAFMVPFSLAWAGIAILWNVAAWLMGAPLFFRLAGVPFLLVGFHLLVGRLLVRAWSRRRLVYALTNRRLLVLGGRRLEARDLASLFRIELAEHRNGRGTITFPRTAWGHAPDPAGMFFAAPTLEQIEQPRVVCDLIRRESDRRREEDLAADSL